MEYLESEETPLARAARDVRPDLDLHHLHGQDARPQKQTLLQNIAAKAEYCDMEFVVLNHNSSHDMHNVAFRHATGTIDTSVDADNYTEELGGYDEDLDATGSTIIL